MDVPPVSLAGVAIAPIDPADDADIDAALRVMDAARAVDVPDFPSPCRRAYAGLLRHPVSSSRQEFSLARLGDTVVGYLELKFPLRDNLDTADVALQVDPAYRRRGVGRRLHEHAMNRLREMGRKRAFGFTNESLPGGPPREVAGAAFATAMGAQNALAEVRRRLDLSTVEEGRLDELLVGARAKGQGYQMVCWANRSPDEYIADIAYLDGRLVTDAPMGELVYEPEQIDTARIREAEAHRDRRGIRTYSAGAVHVPSGRMVALTTLGLEESTPHHAFQWITIVDPDHRGHRLGTLVKVENLRYALAHEPALAVLDTWNAAVNDHMIAINEALGYRPVDRWINWQQEV